ncbi:helix-turn-helix transcriptional regulator [Klebsiella pneumoniae]|uniref:AraC family transcriptional regulator n=1 Tax=Klebsiella pneumoniae TaxID=573 RepID=UPI0015E21C68|nr:AraC family transcriptional regulator [Klebsiella pneumoniae]EKX5121549.1 helix-turn-helix transcriptional regulator [Klebsiella pneumoniae]
MATNCYDITYLIWEARATGKRFYRWNNVRYDEKGDALNGRMMDNDINQLIDALLKKQTSLGRVYFAGETRPPAEPVVQVDFPRLNILLDGQLPDQALGDNAPLLEAHDVLYIPGDSWNCPQWQAPCLLLSILFAKQQLECSLQHWNGKAITVVDKRQALRRGPRVGSFLLQALNELRMQPQEQQTARSIVVSLLSHCHDLLGSQAQTSSRSQALFEAIRQYMDIHYAEPLSRESVAQAFYLSPNYLSHLFQKCGPMGFNEYLNHIRLEQARMLLKGHDMKVKDIAHACGFADSNYFCRLFRKTTERSPSEYRRQYHSQLTEKTSPVKN